MKLDVRVERPLARTISRRSRGTTDTAFDGATANGG
jgi:hypothetical protein